MSLSPRRRMIVLVLMFAAAQSWVRLAVVPLWAHYDERTHYEYLRFVVLYGRWPRPGDVDRAILERANAAGGGVVAICDNRPSAQQPLESCLSPGHQFDEMPGYYFLQALVQWVFRPTTVEDEVALARALSGLLMVLVAWLAYLTVRQIFPDDFLLSAAVPAFMATILGYVDLMNALSNDVGAVVAFSFLILAAIRVIQRGARWTNILVLICALASCLVAKSSTWIGLPLAGIGLWLAIWPRLPAGLKWAGVVAGVAALGLSFDLRSPAGWLRDGQANRPGRVAAHAPLGQYAFLIEYDGNKNPALWQALSPEVVSAARGKTLAIGAWVRAPEGPALAPLPRLSDGDQFEAGREVAATAEWKFYSYTALVPQDVRTLGMYLPGIQVAPVEFDGVVLTVEPVPETGSPQFADADASRGTWSGLMFENLVKNGSAEAGWPLLRPELNRLLPEGGANYRLPSFYDWKRTGPAYWPALRWQLVSFWTAFGNGSPGLPVSGMLAVAAVMLASGLGLVRALWLRLKSGMLAGSQWRALLFCGIAVAMVLAMSVLRIDPVDVTGSIYYLPTARHVYVVIIPMVLLIVMGWLAWWPRRWQPFSIVLLLITFYGLGVWSLFWVQLPQFRP